MRTAGQFFINGYTEENFKLTSGLFTSIEGRKFDYWINRSVAVASIDTGTNVITLAENHNFSKNSLVEITATTTIPGGLSASTRYYVITGSNPLTLQLSLTYNGSAIDITSAGAGTIAIKRYNGHALDGLNNNPVHILESIIRDEVLKETGIVITDMISNFDNFVISGNKNNIDDHYNGSVLQLHHKSGIVGQNEKVVVTDFNGTTNEITNNGVTPVANPYDSVCEIYNIQGNKKIDCGTFDRCGNTTDGNRKDWIFGVNINKRINIMQLINTLLFEMQCNLTVSNGKYKIIALEESAVDTWTNPLKVSGRESVSSAFTPLEDVYNNFSIRWKHDAGSNDYQRKLIVNRNSPTGYLTTNNILGDYESNLCRWSYEHYKIEKTYDYGCAFIYDDETAEYFIQKLIRWFHKRRLMVQWQGDFKNYIKYEIGDVVYLDYPKYIPASMRGVSKFMIIGKAIHARQVPYLTFTLTETF